MKSLNKFKRMKRRRRRYRNRRRRKKYKLGTRISAGRRSSRGYWRNSRTSRKTGRLLKKTLLLIIKSQKGTNHKSSVDKRLSHLINRKTP